MQLWIEAEALRLTNIRAGQNRKAGNPGPEGSIAKLMFAEVNKDIYELCVDLLGPGRARRLRLHDAPVRAARPRRPARVVAARCSCGSRANSIEGGTSEIQRNIIGERVLGLPGEPRTDKEHPLEGRPPVVAPAQPATLIHPSGG